VLIPFTECLWDDTYVLPFSAKSLLLNESCSARFVTHYCKWGVESLRKKNLVQAR
jgi:hypothetical protein